VDSTVGVYNAILQGNSQSNSFGINNLSGASITSDYNTLWQWGTPYDPSTLAQRRPEYRTGPPTG
jgi:hypothetical protein